MKSLFEFLAMVGVLTAGGLWYSSHSRPVFYQINFYPLGGDGTMQRTLECERFVKLIPGDKAVYIRYVEEDGSPELVAADPTMVFVEKNPTAAVTTATTKTYTKCEVTK